MGLLLRGGPLLVGLALVLLLGWRFGLGGLAEAVRHVSAADLALYLAFTAAVVFGYALRWQFVARALGTAIPLPRLASARLAGDAVGGLVPSGRLAGEPVRVAIVCAGGVEGTTASAGVALDRVLETVSNIVCALFYVSVFSLTHTLGDGYGSVRGMAIGLVIGLAAIAVPIVLLRRGSRPLAPFYALLHRHRPTWIDAIRRTEDHLVRLARARPQVFAWGLLFSIATEGLVLCQFHFLLQAFGVPLDLPTLMLVLVGTGVAHAVPTPAALGTLEGTQVAVFGLAAGDPALGFVAGAVIRLHETLLLVAGLVALSAHGLSLSRLRLSSREVSA